MVQENSINQGSLAASSVAGNLKKSLAATSVAGNSAVWKAQDQRNVCGNASVPPSMGAKVQTPKALEVYTFGGEYVGRAYIGTWRNAQTSPLD